LRFVVFGAGAIGGVVGARLHQAGHEVALIARGAHYEAIVRDGRAPPASRASAQDTAGALDALASVAPAHVPVVCLQNGVENERLALRIFANVYGALVMLPAEHLEPGVVQAYSTPLTGGIDVGRYPRGVDATCEVLTAALSGARLSSLARGEIMRWKYAKLLLNLGNVIEALCGPHADDDELDAHVREEGRACLRAGAGQFGAVRARSGSAAGRLAARAPRPCGRARAITRVRAARPGT
jgi:2-dehydropantoate 2-reductase